MGKIKAYEISAEATPATAPTATTTAISPAAPLMGSVVGDIDASDITIPRLNLVQGVGNLAELFTPGQIVLNQETVLSNGSTPVEITVLSARKQFIENLGFDEDARPKVFDTLDEVHAAGGTINWIGDTRPTYVPVLHANIIVKAPAGVEGARRAQSLHAQMVGLADALEPVRTCFAAGQQGGGGRLYSHDLHIGVL